MLPNTTVASATSKPIRQPVLPSGLAANDHRSQEDSCRQKRSRNPENRQLKVPGASQVERQHTGEINAEETGEVCTIMLGGPPEHCLQEKEQPHNQEKPRAGPLGGRKHNFIWRTKGNGLLFASMPPQKVPAAERSQQNPNSTQQSDQ